MKLLPFKWKRRSKYVGVDLGTHAIKVVEAHPGNPPQIKNIGQVRLPVGQISGGVYKNINIISEKLQYLLKNLKIKNRKAVVSISSYAAIIKRITINLTEDKDIETAIYEEVEAHIPFDLEDVYLDYQIISQIDHEIDTIVVAAKRELIDNVIEIISQTNLIPVVIDVDILAIINLVEYLYKPTTTSIIIDLGASKTSIILWDEGNYVGHRDISYGTAQINNYIKEIKNINYEEAERLKFLADKEDLKYVQEAFKKYIDDIYQNIKDTTLYFESIFGNCRAETFYICGGGSQIPFIEKFLENQLKKEVIKINPFQGLKISKLEDKSLDFFSGISCTAISLAIRELI